MSIKLRMPYKIVQRRSKRYESHYSIPSEKALVIPVRMLGDEVSCDVRWEDENGELHLLENKIFVEESLEPLSPMLEPKLHELWAHYYETEAKTESENSANTQLN